MQTEEKKTLEKHIANGGDFAVHVHAFTVTACGSQSYETDISKADGFCSMVRIETPEDEQQPFDILLEADHEHMVPAAARAEYLASTFAGNSQSWELY